MCFRVLEISSGRLSVLFITLLTFIFSSSLHYVILKKYFKYCNWASSPLWAPNNRRCQCQPRAEFCLKFSILPHWPRAKAYWVLLGVFRPLLLIWPWYLSGLVFWIWPGRVGADRLSLLHHEIQLTRSTYIHSIHFHKRTVGAGENYRVVCLVEGTQALGISYRDIFPLLLLDSVASSGHFTLQGLCLLSIKWALRRILGRRRKNIYIYIYEPYIMLVIWMWGRIYICVIYIHRKNTYHIYIYIGRIHIYTHM